MLLIDDERPALDELAFLLARDPRVGEVLTCDSATDALRTLHEIEVDAVFLDIQMPGLTGLDLAQVLARFRVPPPVVFVTAHDEHAVEAFELRAVDYVLKPVREERLAEAVRRVVEDAGRSGAVGGRADPRRARRRHPLRQPLGRSPTSRPRATTRACTPASDAYLLRTPLTRLADDWASAGLRADPPLHAGRPSPTSRSSAPTTATARSSSTAASWR